MKEMGFLVIRIRIEQPVKAANSYVLKRPLHTQIKRITLGTRLKIKPLRKTNLSADMAIHNLKRRPYFNTVNENISYKLSVMNTLTITETKLCSPYLQTRQRASMNLLADNSVYTFLEQCMTKKQTHRPNLKMFLLLLFVCLLSTQKNLWGYFLQ